MNITLTVSPDTALSVPALPEFDPIRWHVSAVVSGVRIVIGSNVAIGAHLAQLSDNHRPDHGGKREAGTALTERPWREIVAEQTGKSWEYCRRAEKVARDLLTALKGKRGKDEARVRELLTNPAQAEWTFADYETIARVVGDHFDVVTWTELLQEFGILPKSGIGNGGKGARDPKKALPIPEQARVFARGYLNALTPSNVSQYRQYLGALPLTPSGDSKEPSLMEIRATLEERMKEVKEVIDRKMN